MMMTLLVLNIVTFILLLNLLSLHSQQARKVTHYRQNRTSPDLNTFDNVGLYFTLMYIIITIKSYRNNLNRKTSWNI